MATDRPVPEGGSRVDWVVGATGRFDGIYIAHWEVSRFEVESGRKWFGLLPRIERCKLETTAGIPSLGDVVLPDGCPPDWRRSPGESFSMSFHGEVLERGRFGHMGWCHWRLLVTDWIAVESR